MIKYELDLAKDLTNGLRGGEFSIVLQPKIAVATGKPVGAEVLSRWYHPRFGYIAPDSWVMMAESLGLMRELTHWLVQEALRCVHLAYLSPGQFQLAINVCPSIFDEQLLDFIASKFSECGVSPRFLELELTESVKPKSIEALAAMVRYAQSMGFNVALDDFGSGFNSMRYLVELPIDTVKIDRSIVQKVTNNSSASLICSTLIDLVHTIGAQVVCEGVETDEQYQTIASMGADLVQGYLYGQPMAVDSIVLYLNGGSSKPRSLRECN